MRYRAYGVVLSSDLELPELELAVGDEQPALVIAEDRGRVPEDGWQWTQPRPSDDEEPWVAIARADGRHRILFDSGAEFVLSADGPTITVYTGSSRVESIRHRLIDQAIPLALAHLGRLVLHASAVVMPSGGAVAFVGPAGAGKSTLAAGLGSRGAAVIADDALVVEREGDDLFAVPSYAGVRITPDMFPVVGWDAADASEGKRRAGIADGLRFADRRASLRRIYVLCEGDGEHPSIQLLPPRETIMSLLAHAFVLDVADKRRVAAQFVRVAAASADVEVRTLAYPRRLSSVADVHRVIAADLASQ